MVWYKRERGKNRDAIYDFCLLTHPDPVFDFDWRDSDPSRYHYFFH